jgi:cell fate (sporulation/competence/biofilm development) regulator YlbF (YheA/YmcA/DUF963 family)
LVDLTEGQLKLLIPLVKIELGRKAQDYTNYMIARNRYKDLMDTIEDTEYQKDEVQSYQDKINMYNELMDFAQKDMKMLEDLVKELNEYL